MRSKTPVADAVDPALLPFFDVIAEILVAQEVRLAETRRALRAAALSLPVERLPRQGSSKPATAADAATG